MSYKVARSQVESLYDQFCKLLCPPANAPPAAPLAPLTIAQSLLGGFVDLTSFLRTNVDIKGQTFAINEAPLVAEVFRAARRSDGLPPTVKMYYPFVFTPNINPTTTSAILTRIRDVRDLRVKAAKFISDVADVDPAIAKAKAKVDQLKAAIEQTNAKELDAIRAEGVNPLTSYIRAENLRAAMNLQDAAAAADKGYWLQLTVVNAGGNNRIKTNLIVDIFTGGNRLSHSGGAIVQYSLFNSQGQVVASDTITEYTNYIKAGKIKRLPCAEVDDFGQGDSRPDV